MKIAAVPLMVALVSAAILIASGYGSRFGVWDYRVGFTLLRVAFYAGAATAVLAILGLLIPRIRRGRVGVLVAGLAVGAAVAYFPWHLLQTARGLPPINDITTDTENPPAFVAVIPLRAGSPVPVAYPGADTAAKQHAGYPDLKPLDLPVPPAAAFARALDVARNSGWQIDATDAASGRIEATDITPWFGFRDDVVVRVTPTASGSRIDVRSLSRVGRGDVGTNAKRIRGYLERVGRA